MGVVERTKKRIIDRRQRLLEGKINSISSPLVRFRDDFLGIERGKEYVITSFTKGSKTQFSSFMFIFTPLFYAFENPDKIRVKFFMYLLEETPEDMTMRFMSHLIYKLTKGRLSISPTDLDSTRNDNPLSQEVLDLMDTEEFIKYMNFYEDRVEFFHSTNPTGIYHDCLNYAKEHGTIYTKKKKYKDELGITKETDGFDYYIPDDEDEYRIIYIDHISLISSERGMTLKQSIDKVGEYCILLRDDYKFTPVLVQQQNTDNESMDAMKMSKLRPTVAGLADSKYTARNTNVLLGLFSPIKFDLKEYHGLNSKNTSL